MTELFEKAVHESHIGTTIFIAIVLILVAMYSHWCGRIGQGDVGFLFIRLYPERNGRRKIRAVNRKDDTLEEVVRNIWLRFIITWSFWRSKTITLTIDNAKLKRKIMSRFQHCWSEIMNEEAHRWVCRTDDEPDEVHFVFAISDVQSLNQRQIRSTAITVRDLRWIRDNNADKIDYIPELAFLQAVLQSMAEHPDTLSYVSAFLPEGGEEED